MILVDSSYDSGKNEVLFVKIGAMVLDLQLDVSLLPKDLGPNCPKLVVGPRPQMSKMSKIFQFKLHKTLHKRSSYFQILGHF